MKIKRMITQYGTINYIEVAGIDMTKDEHVDVKFTPEKMSYLKVIGKDQRILNLENQEISPHDKKELGYFYNSVFLLPLEEYNLDWHIINKDFANDNEYIIKMKKAKHCPIVVDDSSFMQWFVKIYPYLNDEWKNDNQEYMVMMDKKIFAINERMLNGFKNQNIKEIKSAIKLGADINYERNGESTIKYTIENQNINLMKYLINKKIKITQDFIISENNAVYKLYINYLKTFSKKTNIIEYKKKSNML